MIGKKNVASQARLASQANVTATNGKDTSVTPASQKLDEALEMLEKQFETIKSVMTDIVVLSVEQKTAEFKKEKEAEMVALKTVVDASKQNNMVTELRKRLSVSQ